MSRHPKCARKPYFCYSFPFCTISSNTKNKPRLFSLFLENFRHPEMQTSLQPASQPARKTPQMRQKTCRKNVFFGFAGMRRDSPGFAGMLLGGLGAMTPGRPKDTGGPKTRTARATSSLHVPQIPCPSLKSTARPTIQLLARLPAHGRLSATAWTYSP